MKLLLRILAVLAFAAVLYAAWACHVISTTSRDVSAWMEQIEERG